MKDRTGLVKRTTIYDIAKEVGTSAATVSRVFCNNGYPVSDELRRKILLTAEELHYSINIAGRTLKKNKTRDIGVIVPTISNPFYTSLVLGIEMEARRRGYSVLLCNSFRDAEDEAKYLQTLHQKQVAGIILSSCSANHQKIVELQKYGMKFVACDQDIECVKCSRVSFDYLKGSIMAMTYLIECGHRNIAFITSPLTKKSRKDVYEGYCLALLKHGIPIQKENIIISEMEQEKENCSYEFENGRAAAKEYLNLSVKPTAIIVINDMTAFGVVQELTGRGLKIPEDVSVIGFDNIEFASMIHPPLTTISQPSTDTGKLACSILIDLIEGKVQESLGINLEPSLVIRKSVKNLT